MAIASGKLNGYDSTAKYQSVYLEFWQISQSIANNTTTFGYKAYMQSNVSGASGYTGYGHYTFTGANPIGKVSNLTWSWNYTTSQLIKEGTFTKTHAADGTLASQTLTITAGGSTALGYATVSVSLPVATIPRATTPTVNATTKDMGQAIVITVNGASTTFSHNLYYSFTGIAKTFITTVPKETTSYSWTIPLATLAAAIPNSTSGTVTITAETLSGSTVIGSKTVTFTATVPTSVVPSISSKTATEAVSGLAAQFGALIQGKSKLNLAMSATVYHGATISSYSITGNGQTFSAASGTTGFLSTAGTNMITYRVTDSRGRSASATLNVTVLAYAPPQIHTFRVERVNASGVVDPTGDRVKATYKITVASLGTKNTKTYTLKYKRTDVATWTSVVLSATSFVPDTSTTVTSIFTSHSYDFSLVVADYFESTTVSSKVSSGFVPAHFRAGGKGVGIGMRATRDALEVALPFFLGGVENFHAKHSLPIGVDLNTVTQPGSYRLETNLVNAPSNATWGQMLVIRGGGDTIAQLVFPYNTDEIWRRSGNPVGTSTGTWRGWTLVGGLSSVSWSDILSKPTTATRWPSWSEVTSKPSTFAPTSHSHAAAQLPNAYSLLWSGTISTAGASATLNSAYSNFDFLIVVIALDNASSENHVSVTIPVGTISSNARRFSGGLYMSSSSYMYLNFTFPSTTSIQVSNLGGTYTKAIKYVYGVKIV